MPQIVEYINKENIQPTDRGTEARVQEGRRIGALFNQRAESLRDFGNRTAQQIGGAIRDAGDAAVQYQQHREISQGVSTYAQLQDDLSSKWNDLANHSDPNDPSVRQKFLDETLKPSLQKWGETFQTDGGQKWALGRTNALLDHMYEKTAADDMTRAGQALETNVRTLRNSQAQTAYNDPSMVEHLRNNNEASIDGLIGTSNLKGVTAGKAKTQWLEQANEEITKAGGIGAIDKSGNPMAAAEQYLSKHAKFLTPAAQEAIRSHAREADGAMRADESRARTLFNQQKHDMSELREGQYLEEIYSDDYKRSSKVTAKAISSDYNLLPATRKSLIATIEREAKPETERRISERTTVDFLRRLRDPNVDMQKILTDAMDARNKNPGELGSLTRADLQEIRNEVAGRRDPAQAKLAKDRDEFFKRYISTIDPTRDPATGLGKSPLGDQKIYQATEDAKRLEGVLRAKGQDPHSLYDPASPNFLGNSIAKYRPSMQEETEFKAQAARDKASKLAPPVPIAAPAPIAAPERNANFNERFGFDAAATVNVRPPAEREPNKVYDTLRGKLKWTGTGWVQP